MKNAFVTSSHKTAQYIWIDSSSIFINAIYSD